MYKHLYDSFKHWYTADQEHPGTIYFYSDPHFGDEESFEFRKKTGNLPKEIQTIQDLDEYQIKMINKMCNKYDTLVCLGDVGNIECVKKLKAGRKILILGNHDKGASNYKRAVELKQIIYDDSGDNEIVFKMEEEAIERGFKLDGYTQFIDYLQKRYSLDNHLFDEVYEGPLVIGEKLILSHEPLTNVNWAFNLHGHVHSKAKKNDNLHYNFCLEVIDYKPINLNQWLKDGHTSKIQTIHRTTIDKATKRKRNKNDSKRS